MKNIFIIFLTIFITISFSYSQTETITIAECEIDTTANQYDKLLKYFIIDKEEVRKLWKFNTVDWGTFNPSIGLEQKISKKTSLEAEVKLFLGSYNINKISVIFAGDGVNMDRYQPKAELSLDYRFYYNQKRRDQKGKLTNGFSGNYFFIGAGIGVGSTVHLEQYYYSGSINPRYSSYSLFTATYRAKAGYGIQRRIGNIGYADIKLGLLGHTYQTKENSDFNGVVAISPFIDLNFGFALKSLKRPFFK